MAIINKVTELRPINGSDMPITHIQSHIDDMNADGYQLIGIDNLIGWYRFFWSKSV